MHTISYDSYFKRMNGNVQDTLEPKFICSAYVLLSELLVGQFLDGHVFHGNNREHSVGWCVKRVGRCARDWTRRSYLWLCDCLVLALDGNRYRVVQRLWFIVLVMIHWHLIVLMLLLWLGVDDSGPARICG